MSDLRSFIFLDREPAADIGIHRLVDARVLPRHNMAAQIIEVAPGLDIEGLTDVALKGANVSVGLLVVERQFGYLEFHSLNETKRSTVLDAIGAREEEASAPQILGSKVVTRVDHQHAFLINRNKLGSMILGGDSLYLLECQPASMPSWRVMRPRKRPISRWWTTG